MNAARVASQMMTGAVKTTLLWARFATVSVARIVLDYWKRGEREVHTNIWCCCFENIEKILRKNKEQINKIWFFYINSKGKRYTEQFVPLMLKKYTKQDGINRNITPHMIWHSVAIYPIENGMEVGCDKRFFDIVP